MSKIVHEKIEQMLFLENKRYNEICLDVIHDEIALGTLKKDKDKQKLIVEELKEFLKTAKA